MPRFTEIHALIIAELSDQKGHANWKLSKGLGKKKGNLKQSLDNLKKIGIVYRGDPRNTTNEKPRHPEQQEFPFFIREDLEVFDTIIRELIKMRDPEAQSHLLSSNYTNDIIKKYGLLQVYETIKKDIYYPDFKCIASKSLLRLPSVKEDFEEYGLSIQRFVLDNDEKILHDIIDYLTPQKINISEILEPFVFQPIKTEYELGSEEHMRQLKSGLAPLPLKKLEILSRLDPLQAVVFSREVLNKRFKAIYAELKIRSAISNYIMDFLVNDRYLSPLTSYPANSPQQLLFSRPFQRVYEDTYVLGKEDLNHMVNRIYSLYDSFVDVLFLFFQGRNPEPKTIETLTKEQIFYWNVSCFGFDIIFKYLYNLYSKEIGSGKFHVKSDGLKLQIFDLETNKPMLDDFVATSLPAIISWPCITRKLENGKIYQSFMDYSFEYLRPSNIFENNKPKSELIPAEAIISELKRKLENSDGHIAH